MALQRVISNLIKRVHQIKDDLRKYYQKIPSWMNKLINKMNPFSKANFLNFKILFTWTKLKQKIKIEAHLKFKK